MKQSEINKLWIQSGDSNVGSITMLVAPKRQANLKKPYEYKAPIKTIKKLAKDIRSACVGIQLQCAYVDTKPVSYGVRLNVFLLGYRPGFCGGTAGVTSEQWNQAVTTVRKLISDALAEEVPMYVEDWNAKQKFQARFETYVMYSEMEA